MNASVQLTVTVPEGGRSRECARRDHRRSPCRPRGAAGARQPRRAQGARGQGPAAKDGVAALRGDGVKVICEVKRSSPSKGALAAIADPAGARRRLRGGRRGRHLRPHRAAPLRRLAGRPGGRPRQGRHPGAAQGLHRHLVPAVGGAGVRRRPRAADRRRPRPGGPGLADRARRVHRAHPARRGARRGRGRARGGRRAPRSSASTRATSRPSRSTAAPSSGSPPRSPTTSSRSPSPASAARTTSSPTPTPAPTRSWSASPWSPAATRRRAVADLVAAGAHPALRHGRG